MIKQIIQQTMDYSMCICIGITIGGLISIISDWCFHQRSMGTLRSLEKSVANHVKLLDKISPIVLNLYKEIDLQNKKIEEINKILREKRHD